jgi:hypothetical protein
MRINTRNYGSRFSIILDSSQLSELAAGDSDLLNEMVESAKQKLEKIREKKNDSNA